jgi:hypothetical protein
MTMPIMRIPHPPYLRQCRTALQLKHSIQVYSQPSLRLAVHIQAVTVPEPATVGVQP